MKVPFVPWYGRIMNGNDITKKYLSDDAGEALENDRVVLAPVKPTTDVVQLARNLARRGLLGARIVMYPLTPFD